MPVNDYEIGKWVAITGNPQMTEKVESPAGVPGWAFDPRDTTKRSK
jgi:hypothetical protein